MRKCYFLSNKGPRVKNEDNLQINKYFLKEVEEKKVSLKFIKNKSVISVSDGMGGESYGELASYISSSLISKIKKEPTKEDVLNKISEINKKINQEMDNKNTRIGSTTVIASINNSKLDIYNVGDSRAYLINSKIIQLSQDHSDAQTGALNRHLGMNDDDGILEPFFLTDITVSKNDYLLLCTDGFYNKICEKEILKIINSNITVKEKMNLFEKEINQNKANDNYTCLLIKF